MPHDQLDALVAEQTAYYRARAGEYDKTSAYDAVSRAALVAALEAFAPYGRVLELACGTGLSDFERLPELDGKQQERQQMRQRSAQNEPVRGERCEDHNPTDSVLLD